MLKQKFIISIISEIIIYLIGFSSLIFVTRLLGPYPLGVISSAQAIMSLISIFGNMGFGIAHVKLVSEGESIDKCISTFFIIKTFTNFLMLIIFFTLFINNLIPGFQKNSVEGLVILIIFVSTFINSFNDIGNFTLTAQIKVSIGKSILILQKLINSILRIFVAFTKKNVIWLAIAELFTSITGLFFYIITFRKIKFIKPNRELIKKYFSFGLPSLVITINAILLSNVLDRIFLNSFVNPEEVGYYTTALSFVIIFTFISNNLNNILLPFYSESFKRKDYDQINHISLKLEKYIYIIFSPIVIYSFLYSKDFIVFLFSEKMLRTGEILPFVILYSFIFLLNRPLATKILGFGKFNKIMWMDILNLIINLLLFSIFIPDKLFGIKLFNLGAVGAAISLTISTLMLHIIYKIYNKILFNDSYSILNILFILISIIIFSIIKDINFYFKLKFLLDFILGFHLYFLLIFLLGLFSKKEFREFLEFVSFNKIKGTVKEEFKSI